MARPRDETKPDTLLDAALIEIARRGLDNLSVDAVAKRASVAPATLYVYFKGKDALIEALYSRVKLSFSAAVLADDAGPIRHGVEAICGCYLHYCQRHPNELIFLEQIEASPTWRARMESITAKAMRPMMALLDRGKAEGIVKDIDNNALVSFMAGGIQALARKIIEDPDEQLTRELVTFCWDAIKT